VVKARRRNWGFTGIFTHKQSVRVSGDPQRSGSDRIPWLSGCNGDELPPFICCPLPNPAVTPHHFDQQRAHNEALMRCLVLAILPLPQVEQQAPVFGRQGFG
jgi:hypothetical protein